MPGVENKIWGFKYDEPYSELCYKEVCTPFGCTDIPYPCIGMRRKEFSVLAGFTYPSVTTEQQATIYACAATAGVVVYGIVATAAASCGALGPACIPVVIGAIASANEAGKASFFECLNKSGLSQEVISKCTFLIYTRKENA